MSGRGDAPSSTISSSVGFTVFPFSLQSGSQSSLFLFNRVHKSSFFSQSFFAIEVLETPTFLAVSRWLRDCFASCSFRSPCSLPLSSASSLSRPVSSFLSSSSPPLFFTCALTARTSLLSSSLTCLLCRSPVRILPLFSSSIFRSEISPPPASPALLASSRISPQRHLFRPPFSALIPTSLLPVRLSGLTLHSSRLLHPLPVVSFVSLSRWSCLCSPYRDGPVLSRRPSLRLCSVGRLLLIRFQSYAQQGHISPSLQPSPDLTSETVIAYETRWKYCLCVPPATQTIAEAKALHLNELPEGEVKEVPPSEAEGEKRYSASSAAPKAPPRENVRRLTLDLQASGHRETKEGAVTFRSVSAWRHSPPPSFSLPPRSPFLLHPSLLPSLPPYYIPSLSPSSVLPTSFLLFFLVPSSSFLSFLLLFLPSYPPPPSIPPLSSSYPPSLLPPLLPSHPSPSLSLPPSSFPPSSPSSASPSLSIPPLPSLSIPPPPLSPSLLPFSLHPPPPLPPFPLSSSFPLSLHPPSPLLSSPSPSPSHPPPSPSPSPSLSIPLPPLSIPSFLSLHPPLSPRPSLLLSPHPPPSPLSPSSISLLTPLTRKLTS
ncbi:hypothetical protein C7M84_014933 [Penaeus vannamei]|uniref:Uncharacterized protein n=1 Tax=Penaeus vannamei TaxID=6689 RepID=A0A3R7PCY7_PENVA|nr:hypothetical protein C7M84_014933 [Penaeus vannamei]